MKKKEMIEIGIIIVAAIFLLFNLFGKKGATTKKKKINFQQKKEMPLVSEAQQQKKSSYDDLQESTKSLELQRDPFSRLPLVYSRDVSLIGIAWDPQQPLAIINGEVVTIGEMIGGKTVVDIQPDRVIIQDGERLVELTIAEGILSETP